MKKSLFLCCSIAISACSHSTSSTPPDNLNDKASYQLRLASDVTWDHLNPARGNKAPKAATLWGDRKGKQATGFLLRPSDGFKSPPHIHNVSYRGVVIAGELHNDDPNAANMWMPAGSFWTQPKGEVHITAAKGSHSLAYIEIEEGPYLVQPTNQAYDSHERPINVDSSNLVWLNIDNTQWQALPSNKTIDTPVKIALLWGQQAANSLNGTLLRIPANFNGHILSDSDSFKGIVIKGDPNYQNQAREQPIRLTPGSYFGSLGKAAHSITTQKESLIYIRTQGQYRVSAN